jgi:hypothetical protein
MLSDHIAEYLEGVTGVVEANTYESHQLWLNYANDSTAIKYGGQREARFDWKSTGSGYGACVGYVGNKKKDRSIWISLLTVTVKGQKLLFYFVTGRYADYDVVREWLDTNMPSTAFYTDERARLNHVDAQNFHNVFSR